MINTLTTITALILLYKLILPFVGLIVGTKSMNDSANYIERTERRFPTKDVIKWLIEWLKRKKDKKID